MTTWHDNDDFWATMAPFMFGEERWDAAPTEMEQVISLLGVAPESAILDLCCGPGRHSLELARRGFRVTGVDRTAAYLQRACQRTEREGLAVEFVQDDMRHFCRPNGFDSVIMMFTSFGYFEEPAENRQVLANAHRSLKDQGTLIIETMGKEILARIFSERDWIEQDGVIFLQERKVSKNWSWMENRWIRLDNQGRHEFKVSHWIYSAVELYDMLTACGFSSVDVYGDIEGAPYDHKAKRLVTVAHK
jgi:SAM-dependent methyltransferase